MAQIETWLKTDLKHIVRVQELDGGLFTADNQANRIGVILTDNGADVTITGGVTAYMIRGDEATLIMNGSSSGNRAWIDLPASAYTKIGPFSIVIKNGTTTIGACTGYMYRSTTDEIVDPGHVIPSIEELLAEIENTKAAGRAATAAAQTANTAATNADSKAATAQTAANTANTAATNADNKAAEATAAKNAANSAASKIDNLTIIITQGDPSLPPSSRLDLVDGHYQLTISNVKGLKGDTGDAFHIKKTYASVAAMNADYGGTDTVVGDYVMVVSNVEDPDNAKVYIKGSSAWQFVVDMSGATGIKGDTGTGITGASFSNYQLTLTFSDGTNYTTPSIRGAQGIRGEKGDHGVDAYVHIRYSHTNPTADTDMKTTGDDWIGIYSGNSATAPTHYTDYTWYKIKGETGSVQNAYASTLEMAPTDSRKIKDVLDAKAEMDTDAVEGNFASFDANGNPVDSGNKSSDYIKTINGRLPNPVTGDIVVIEGGGSSSYGAYRIDATIAPSDWVLTNGVYRVTITSTAMADIITSNMDGSETWLDDETAMLGETTFTSFGTGSGDGGIYVDTAVLPTASWGLHILLAMNGADVLSDLTGKINDAKTIIGSGISIIVDGDAATAEIAPGEYAYIKNNTHGLAEGIYYNSSSSAFPVSGGTASSAVFSIPAKGGLNALNSDKQSKMDTGLNTTIKTIVGAINEHESDISTLNSKTSITLTAGTGISIQGNDSKYYGSGLVSIVAQLQTTAAISSGNTIFTVPQNASPTVFGGVVLIDTNDGTVYSARYRYGTLIAISPIPANKYLAVMFNVWY